MSQPSAHTYSTDFIVTSTATIETTEERGLTNKKATTQKPLPFLQWVGGKRKLTDQLIKNIPSGLNNYYEPFLGGGALFFAIKGRFKQYFLSDINLDLVTSYNAIKKNPEHVSNVLDSHIIKHSKEYYYQMRDCNNNNNPTLISARFLYLNRYAFKGIYRINRNGKLGLSFSSKNYKRSEDSRLEHCSSFLQDTTIYAGDFSFIDARKNDFVYFDPPYHKAGERFYTRLPFDENEQIRLKDFAQELSAKGVRVMISNSDTEFIRDLYQGFNIHTVEIKYSIHEQRKISKELVIMNY